MNSAVGSFPYPSRRSAETAALNSLDFARYLKHRVVPANHAPLDFQSRTMAAHPSQALCQKRGRFAKFLANCATESETDTA